MKLDQYYTTALF